jgi:hypothetical protein
VSFSVAARNAMLAALAALVDADAGPGTVKVYTGGPPATPETAPTGTLLLTFTLAATAFEAPASASMNIDALPITATGAAAGTAGWFRIADASGDGAKDGLVGASGSGAELELSTTTVSVGLSVDLETGTFTMPAG